MSLYNILGNCTFKGHITSYESLFVSKDKLSMRKPSERHPVCINCIDASAHVLAEKWQERAIPFCSDEIV